VTLPTLRYHLLVGDPISDRRDVDADHVSRHLSDSLTGCRQRMTVWSLDERSVEGRDRTRREGGRV
jgi:hypothetical protein